MLSTAEIEKMEIDYLFAFPSYSRKDSNRGCHNFKQNYIFVGCKSCGNRVEHTKCLRLNRATSYSRLVFTQKHGICVSNALNKS